MAQNTLFSIPSQTLSLSNYLADNYKKDTSKKTVVRSFSITNQITLGEYKAYLNDILRDSSLAYCKSQWPDSSIAAKQILEKYMTDKIYENYSVVGISWFKVINYCRWRTLKEAKDSIAFVYRLPLFSEWVAAEKHLSKNKIGNDFNGNYSDWLLSTFDESAYDWNEKMHQSPYDYFYLSRGKDAKVLTRKRYIGNSFLQQSVTFTSQTYYYASEGMLCLSFRLVKEPHVKTNGRTLSKSLLNYYGILK